MIVCPRHRRGNSGFCSLLSNVEVSAMKNFVIVLKNEKVKTYTIISWLIITLNFLVFLYFGISIKTGKIEPAFLTVTGALFVIFILRLIMKKKKEKSNDFYIVYFIIIIFSWIKTGYYWIAAINLLLYVFQFISSRKLEILFADTAISYPSFPIKNFQWNELNNVILKDGILTIDFKNNKLIQQTIDENSSSINEKEFNEFCKRQLAG